MGQPNPVLRLVESRPIAAINKPYSIDITQVDERCGMMSVDACLPIPIVMQLLKLLEDYK